MVISRFLRPIFRDATQVIKSNAASQNPIKRALFKKDKSMLLPKERKMSAYEGDGKTVGFVINKKQADVLLIRAVMTEGFVMASGAELYGSMILFPHTIFSWNILKAKNVTEEAFVLFKLLEPKIDILVFGYGSKEEYLPEVRQNFTQICRKLGLRYEALPTEDAVGVYNFLAEERRLVAGALIPPSTIDVLKFDRTHKYLLDDENEDEEVETIAGNNVETKLIK